MRRRTDRKIMAILLSAVMLTGMVPSMVFAEE